MKQNQDIRDCIFRFLPCTHNKLLHLVERVFKGRFTKDQKGIGFRVVIERILELMESEGVLERQETLSDKKDRVLKRVWRVKRLQNFNDVSTNALAAVCGDPIASMCNPSSEESNRVSEPLMQPQAEPQNPQSENQHAYESKYPNRPCDYVEGY